MTHASESVGGKIGGRRHEKSFHAGCHAPSRGKPTHPQPPMNTSIHSSILGAMFAAALISTAAAETLVANYTTGDEVPLYSHGFSAQGQMIQFSLSFAPPAGARLMVVNNTSAALIEGTFLNLVQGQVVALAHAGKYYHFIAHYYGGTGNDLVLIQAGAKPVAWGNNGGLLGDGTTEDRSSPVPVAMSNAIAGKIVVSMATGSDGSLALCSDGSLLGWGPRSITGSLEPATVEVAGTYLEGKNVIGIASGNMNFIAVCSDGTIADWGTDSLSGSTLPALAPTAGTALQGKKVVAVAAGELHTLALCSDGSLAAWGDNSNGQLGDGTTTDRDVPVAVITEGTPLAGKTVVAITVGWGHSVAL